MKIQTNDLLQLSSTEFRDLCNVLLRTATIEELKLNGFHQTHSYNTSEYLDVKKLAVGTAQMRFITVDKIDSDVRGLIKKHQNKQWVAYFTSAYFDDNDVKLTERRHHKQNLSVISRDRLLALANKYKEDLCFIFDKSQRRIKIQLAVLLISATALVSLALFVITSIAGKDRTKAGKKNLAYKIHTAEDAIDKLKKLEDHLRLIRDNMKATTIEHNRIVIEYERALELKQLSRTQMEMLRKSLTTIPIVSKIMDYGIGFMLGVSSSFIAAVLFSWFRRGRTITG